MKTFNIILDHIGRGYRILFESESDLITDEAIEILTNEEDSKLYFNAIKKAKKENKRQEVKLSGNRTIIVAP